MVLSQVTNPHQSAHQPTSRHDNPPAVLDAGFDPEPWHTLMVAVRDAFHHALPARLDTPNTSLALTRALVEACGYLNIHAQPVPVFIDITRGTHTGAHREGGIDERALLSTPTGWAGHLITVVNLGTGRYALLDIAADRFDRPIRNLYTGAPLLVPLTSPTPAATTTPADTSADTPSLTRLHPQQGDDTTLTYRPIPTSHPHHDDWRTSPWWQPHTKATRIALRTATTVAAAVTTRTGTAAAHTTRPDSTRPTHDMPVVAHRVAG